MTDISELRKVGLKDCDRLLTRQTLKWRTVGALEGGAMGALAMIPVAGLPVSMGADVVVIDVLSLSIATRVAHSYGFDARDPAEREFIDTVIETAVAWNLAKTGPLVPAHKAHGAVRGRLRWSKKLREDHRLVDGLEKFMARWYRGGHVPVQHVGKALWGVGIAIGAGTNARTLGRVAEHTRAYCQTRWLSERYGLPLPPALADIHPTGFDPPTPEDPPGTHV
ncbi:EcsC family protein [Cellulomonas sp. ATA003]|uniref:EcsC family protein n=1 Tax=Cellulomonas sp. ATA003 TaxID=3073064 RepID=UPI002873B42A|nr:EcsC family protein [Cellulomonas sp. ATA003]WNB85756.1 EcsC family protein [Cellulomonas sp. ATA003]